MFQSKSMRLSILFYWNGCEHELIGQNGSENILLELRWQRLNITMNPNLHIVLTQLH